MCTVLFPPIAVSVTALDWCISECKVPGGIGTGEIMMGSSTVAFGARVFLSKNSVSTWVSIKWHESCWLLAAENPDSATENSK